MNTVPLNKNNETKKWDFQPSVRILLTVVILGIVMNGSETKFISKSIITKFIPYNVYT
jgi:hypothetical protein